MSAVIKRQTQTPEAQPEGGMERRRTTRHSGMRIANPTKRRMMEFLGSRLIMEGQVQSAGMEVVVVDHDCKVRIASRSFRKGRDMADGSELDDFPCLSFFSGECPDHRCMGMKALENESEMSEIREFGRGGERILARVNYIPFSIGEETFFMALMKDIEVERRMMAMERLAQAGGLAGGLAHDMNNVLSALLGNLSYLQMFAELQSNPDCLSAIGEMRYAVETGAQLCKGMTRLISEQAPIELTSLVSLVKKTLRLVRHRITSASGLGGGVNVVANIPDDIIVSVPTISIQRCIMNIVLNAVGHGRRDGGGVLNIEISACTFNGTVRITIENDGKMIPPKVQETLLREPITCPSSDNGIGLFSSARSIEMAGGRLSFESSAERTAFHIDIPMEPGVVRCR